MTSARNTHAASILPDLLPQGPVVWVDLSIANAALAELDPRETDKLSAYVDGELHRANARVGLGGYGERRAWYERSEVFRVGNEYRSVHLGLDLWCPAGTRIAAPVDAKVHSFADNASFGDYGPTIILEHTLDGAPLYALYGHLSRESLRPLTKGASIARGEVFATLGDASVNGGWPPHLHWQLIHDIGNYSGDFPGVATPSSAPAWLARCPDPAVWLTLA